MPLNKSQKETCIELEGQLSIWDINITKKTDPSTIILTKIMPTKNEKLINDFGITDMQQDYLMYNNIMKNDNLSRLIKFSGGGLGIELKKDVEYRTIYVNKDGKERFEFYKILPVLPMDKILYYIEEFQINEQQKNNLKDILEDVNYNVKRVIHRKGDTNIIIELQDKIISLIPNGWKLEFIINHIKCEEDEIL